VYRAAPLAVGAAVDRRHGALRRLLQETDMSRTFTTRPTALATRCAPLLTGLLLAACGGGGDEAAPAGTAAPADNGVARSLYAGPALPPAPAGLSGNVTCRNVAIGAIALDSVFVPADAACTLDGTRLIGNVTVGRGAVLEARDLQLGGSVQAEGAAHVALAAGSRVGGSVQLTQGGSARVDGVQITGDLQIDAMRGAVQALANRIGGSLQAVGNFGGLTIDGNAISGNLQCKENQPAPRATNNTAALIEDQCLPGAGGDTGSGGGSPVPPADPLSGNVTCVGLRIGAIALDTVTVPAGADQDRADEARTFEHAGRAGARLTATDVQVNGGLIADGAALTDLGGTSAIGGSVQIKQGGTASIAGASIGGDLQLDAMSGPLAASGNRITGNLQAMANRGGLALIANRMGGALQCKDNLPAPTGGDNTASIKEDQCRGL
jgi:hypothetical protein